MFDVYRQRWERIHPGFAMVRDHESIIGTIAFMHFVPLLSYRIGLSLVVVVVVHKRGATGKRIF